MAYNLIKGKEGEALAADFLAKKGYTILERNFRAGRGEIDLIAKVENLLVFVEVKSRSKTNFGFPEEAVTTEKEAMISKTAERYLEKHNWKGNIRFDIIAISGKTIDHFIDAFA